MRGRNRETIDFVWRENSRAELWPNRLTLRTGMQDHYEKLGVSPAATPDAIKAAYRKKAAQYHPDKNEAADAALRFREVQEAYETLSDAVRRKDFDDYRQRSLIEDPMAVARVIAGKYIQEVLK